MSDDIDPDRKFSNGTDWDNSIDCDDASDGSDGGYDRYGSPINAHAMKELVQLRMETSGLRAKLTAVTEERDRMRTRLDKAHGFISRADWAQFFEEEHVDARAALEGVTEPSAGENNGK